MQNLKNKIWNDEDTMIDEITELGYPVVGIDTNYIYILDMSDNTSEFPTECRLPLKRINNTITIL